MATKTIGGYVIDDKRVCPSVVFHMSKYVFFQNQIVLKFFFYVTIQIESLFFFLWEDLKNALKNCDGSLF